jgi:hypothetical protein
MARPTIDHLLDSQIQIWRPATVSDDIGVEERGYVPVGVVDAFINRPQQSESNVGGGIAPVGGVRWYGRPDIDVRQRDVCEVVVGPEAGKTFEVNAPPVHPMGHHTQVDCIEWNGTLQDVS